MEERTSQYSVMRLLHPEVTLGETGRNTSAALPYTQNGINTLRYDIISLQ